MKYSVIIRYLFIFISLFYVIPASSQKGLSTCYYYNQYWSEWEETEFDWVDIRLKAARTRVSGDFLGFCLYNRDEHPSNYFFKFKITNYYARTKKDIKEHYKNNTPWVYQGTVEYYICDVYPTFEDCLKELKRPLKQSDINTSDYQQRLSLVRANKIRKTGSFTPIGLKRVVKNAEIRIMPYKKYIRCYNFFFDNVGYAIDLGPDGVYDKMLGIR